MPTAEKEAVVQDLAGLLKASAGVYLTDFTGLDVPAVTEVRGKLRAEGGTYRVVKRVSKILDEKTGKMVEMKTPAIILNGVVCQARYSSCRMFCPRSIYSYWREIWLERVEVGRPGTDCSDETSNTSIHGLQRRDFSQDAV